MPSKIDSGGILPAKKMMDKLTSYGNKVNVQSF
jgi:hypothetical protein